MKKCCLTFLLCLITGLLYKTAAQAVYVNHAATGMNNGTSWEDAFTDLKAALAGASEGDTIRVAQGIYRPGTVPAATFMINTNLHLLGGYDGGTGARDPAVYETVLSGDLDNNDEEDDFEQFKSDNAMTVVTIAAAVTNATLIDGLTIRGGHAAAAGGPKESGGGVYCLGAPVFRNCLFEQNYARVSGGGLYLNGSGSQGALIENCQFQKNRADNLFDAGGGLYAGNAAGSGVFVSECRFIENEGGRGGGLAGFASNLTVTNSSFTSNTNIRQGGGLWFWANGPNLALSVDGCTFQGNHSSFGGGVYASLWSDCTATVSNSVFEENLVSPNDEGWGQGGGGLLLLSAPESSGAIMSVDSCRFTGNTSTGNQSGLGMSVNGPDCTCSLTNSYFAENLCTGNYATASIWIEEQSNTDVLVEHCLFEHNESVHSAGLDIGPFDSTGTSTYIVRNCQMLNNHASRYGGGLTLAGGISSSPSFIVEDCLISGNTAGEGAGGLFIQTTSDGFHAALQRCKIQGNHSPRGSAVGAIPFDTYDPVVPTGAVFTLANSLITGNTGSGAILLDSFPGAKITNATIAANEGSAVVLSNFSGFTLQNSLLYNPGFPEFTDLTGDGIVTSNGGNLIGDASLSAFAHSLYDQQNADPLFAGMDDFSLSAQSPAVDAGVDSGDLSDTDLGGNPRVINCIDIGAYESEYMVAAECLTGSREAIAGEVTLSPNPAADLLNIQLPEYISQPVEWRLFDARGRMVRRELVNPGQALSLEGLANGFYAITGRIGNTVYAGRFVKM